MDFLGRKEETRLLRSALGRRKSTFTVVYGRRRVGKTRLIEEAFNDSLLWKFEGIEAENTESQKRHFLARLAELAERPELAQIQPSSWSDILILLSKQLSEKFSDQPVVVFLDEFQWMAADRTKLVSELKYVWDNHLQKNNRIHLILCGSICSFLINKVLRSKAMYGRVHLEINLQPLRLPDIKGIFDSKKNLRDVFQIYMAMGGIPQYLEFVKPNQSARSNIERLCFHPTGYLVNEFERLFISHFGSAPHYRSMLELLAKKGFADRKELQKAAGLTGGGRISNYLEELEMAGFIEGYSPVDRLNTVRGKRYRLSDLYILFYFRFIQGSLQKIKSSITKSSLSQFVSDQAFDIWQGLAFERVCYLHADLIAEKLGFGAVRYDCGSWYNNEKNGAQIDLLFLRADQIATLC